MFSELLDKVEGADLWMVASLAIFLAFFVGVTVFVFYVKKDHIQKMKNLPLDEEGNLNRSAL